MKRQRRGATTDMVICEEMRVTKDRSYWTVSVAPDLQMVLEKIAAHDDKSALTVVSDVIRIGLADLDRKTFLDKVDARIDAAIKQAGLTGIVDYEQK